MLPNSWFCHGTLSRSPWSLDDKTSYSTYRAGSTCPEKSMNCCIEKVTKDPGWRLSEIDLERGWLTARVSSVSLVYPYLSTKDHETSN